jgi:hypothetical protein
VDAGLDNAYDLARERYGDVKACSGCQRRLPIRMFNVKLRHKGVLQSRCRPWFENQRFVAGDSSRRSAAQPGRVVI